MHKKAQEEIVGFVLIIVLVAIIALVFLGISIRKPVEKLPSNEVDSWIQAAKRYSTECYSSPELRKDLKDLIVSCSLRDACFDGRDSCAVLEGTLRNLLQDSWMPGEDSPVKAYNFEARNVDTNQTVISLREGNCSSTQTFSDSPIPSSLSGDIIISLEICT